MLCVYSCIEYMNFSYRNILNSSVESEYLLLFNHSIMSEAFDSQNKTIIDCLHVPPVRYIILLCTYIHTYMHI